MTAFSILALNTSIPKARAPGAGDSYLAESPVAIQLGTITTDVKVLDLTATWNNAGVAFTGIKLDVTNTASNSSSKLLDLHVGGNSMFIVTRSGAIAGQHDGGGIYMAAYYLKFGRSNFINDGTAFAQFTNPHITPSFQISGDMSINWTASANLGGANDLFLWRDAAGVLALRNGTNAQTFRIYNTYTDASNYERGVMRWSSNVLEIGAEAGGTGTLRNISFLGGWTGTAFKNGSDNTAYISGTGSSFMKAMSLGFYSYGNSLISFRLPADASIVQLSASPTSAVGACFEMVEMTAPSAPSANGVRIYAEDNGAGKTRLMALFASGAAQQIAIEP